jgi:hypothetical protein
MTSGIIEILTDNAGVQALAGLNAGGDKYKIYPFRAPQPEHGPYILVGKASNNTQSEGKEIFSTLDYPTYQVLCYHKNFRPTEVMHEAARTALDSNQWFETEACRFEKIWLINDYDSFDNALEMYCHIAIYGAEQRRP